VRADTPGAQRWQYAFSAPETAPLETLARTLVDAGYAIRTLAAVGSGGAGGAALTVTRPELHTPATLERRNRELAALARSHGARYDGIDIMAPP
jgi:hypothetical protein